MSSDSVDHLIKSCYLCKTVWTFSEETCNQKHCPECGNQMVPLQDTTRRN